MSSQRLRYLDIARGIAIISVVLGHLNYAPFTRVVFTYHLPIFYFISGYFLEDRLGKGAFVRKKARRLLLPYFFSALVMLLCVMLRNVLQGQGPLTRFRETVLSILYAAGDSWTKPFPVKAIGALWFLWALFWGEVALRLLLDVPWPLRLSAVAGIFTLCAGTWRLMWLPLSVQAGGTALLFIYLGHLLRQALPKLRAAGIPSEVRAALGLLALAMWLSMIRGFSSFWLVHCDVGHGVSDIIGSACGCAVVIFASRAIDTRLDGPARFLAFFGRYSLLFLALHFLEMHCVPWKAFYKSCLRLTGLADTGALYLWFRLTLKLALIMTLTALLQRVGLVRRIYGYPPTR